MITSILDSISILIISIPALSTLFNNKFLSMHDFQHISRLYLLDLGIKQGYFYPRWVDFLGFGFGYPLFNFYPPLIYYIGEVFHLFGFSLIWSIKFIFILGFFLSGLGIYFLGKKIIGRCPSFLAATLYIYFSYHAVIAYVRGALAGFFAMAILPFLFLALKRLAEKANLKNSFFLGLTISLLVLDHPLIAFPTIFYLAIFLVFILLFFKKIRWPFLKYFIFSGVYGLSLSSFFWLPSFFEKKFTLVDKILTHELAFYKLHFIYPSQFWYSPWGYGGSIKGPFDGMSFQLGKIHIFLLCLSLALSLIYWFKKRTFDVYLKYFYLFFFLTLFSLFMATNYSLFIWERISYLWYLQFPWRFLTFTALFISLTGAFGFSFLEKIFKKNQLFTKLNYLLIIFFSLATIFIYHKYFRPQRLIATDDKKLTSFKEIGWRVSKSSFEFSPKEVKTKKLPRGTTMIDIEKKDLTQKTFKLISGKAKIKTIKNKFNKKIFQIKTPSSAVFQLNRFYFPGWEAFLGNKKVTINANNKWHLMQIDIPPGTHKVKFLFKNTPIRKVANSISATTVLATFLYLLRKKILAGITNALGGIFFWS